MTPKKVREPLAPLNEELVDLRDRWLEDKRDIENKRPRTIQDYRWMTDHFIRWLGDRPITSIHWREVAAWTELDVHKPGGGTRPAEPKYIRKKLMVLRSWWTWLKEEEGVELDPAVTRKFSRYSADVPRTPPPEPAAQEALSNLWHSDLTDENRVWLGLCFICGLRAWEVMALRPGEVLIEERELRDFERKGRSGTIHTLNWGELIDNELQPYLPQVGPFSWWELSMERYRKLREGEQFFMEGTIGANRELRHGRVEWIATELDARWMNRRLKKVLEAAGLPEDAFTPKQMRAAAGTNLWRSGTTIEYLLSIMNHKDYNTTLKAYLSLPKEYQDYRRQKQRERGLPPQ